MNEIDSIMLEDINKPGGPLPGTSWAYTDNILEKQDIGYHGYPALLVASRVLGLCCISVAGSVM